MPTCTAARACPYPVGPNGLCAHHAKLEAANELLYKTVSVPVSQLLDDEDEVFQRSFWDAYKKKVSHATFKATKNAYMKEYQRRRGRKTK